MDGFVILLILLAIYLLVAPALAMARAAEARREASVARDRLEDALERLEAVETELHQLQGGQKTQVLQPVEQPVQEAAATVSETSDDTFESVMERVMREEARISAAERSTVPPPLPAAVPVQPLAKDDEEVDEDDAMQAVLPPPAPAKQVEPFSLERFMGVKLFAWLGGVAMFFGMSFFVKYAFDNNLIPPWMRITLGFLAGAALLGGGLFSHRLPRYRVLAQAFCATGVLVLYGVTFGAHAIYHFPMFGTVQTFVVMAVITFAAFLIAVRLDALVVAVLGMLGGFVTPVLLWTGQDQVLGLFGYIALLDIGLLAVSRHGRWRYLTTCAAAGTAMTQIGWCFQFFNTCDYASGPKILVPMGIAMGFLTLFLAGGWLGRRKPDLNTAGSVLGLAVVAIAFAFAMLGYRQVADRQFLLYGFILLIDLVVIAAVLRQPRLAIAQVIAGLVAFVHLACWSHFYLTPENLTAALVLYLIFGALHAGLPVVLFRRFGEAVASPPSNAGPWMGPAVLLLMLLPILGLSPVPLVVWAAVLMADLLVIGLAVASGGVLPVLATLVMTMALAGLWLTRVPASNESLLPFLCVVAGFSAVFSISGKWLSKHRLSDDDRDRRLTTLVPIGSALLPFVLL
ncbi:DUF2339 domain-containing protein, partial [Ilumatobacter sp.]|uniref:DUF2339 domain-containing protein n=1 Tax=Ilumatobacter sp. TaxID=1967498 RepID=UPI003C45AC13